MSLTEEKQQAVLISIEMLIATGFIFNTIIYNSYMQIIFASLSLIFTGIVLADISSYMSANKQNSSTTQ